MLGSITKNMRNPGATSLAVFAAMLLVAIGSWGVGHTGHGHEKWSELLSPGHVFSLLGVIGSVLVAWLSKSPLKE